MASNDAMVSKSFARLCSVPLVKCLLFTNAGDIIIRPTKSKIQLSKFRDLIGFIKRFTNRAASHLTSREVLSWVVQDGSLL